MVKIGMDNWTKNGRNGNILWQYAFISSLARKMNVDFVLPEWEEAKHFELNYKRGLIGVEPTKERGYAYSDYSDLDFTKDINFSGYYQNEKYFDEKVREEIKFKHEYHQEVREKFKHLFERPTIALGFRRTDYTETGVYVNLPPLYYISALIEHFPDWRNHNLVFISDDLDYCRLHFQCLDNAFFPETKDIEQLCLMSQCDNFIIANSTFHWWAAFIGEKEYGKIIQPTKLFKGKLLQQYGDINFYSDRWINHEPKKIDLKDVTFTIPCLYDHEDRLKNMDICLKLLEDFDTNVIIGEQGGDKFSHLPNYMSFDSKEFHRTKMLNDMARKAETPIIANWDCDVAIPPMQLLETVHKIRNGAEMCYPYEYNFIRLSFKVKEEIKNNWDLGDYAKYNFPNNDSRGKPSFGGAVLWNKQKYFEIGGENEYFISFGPEDVERMERAKCLGVRIERTRGDLYHFPHWCGPNSSVSNPYFKKNRQLLEKQRLMNKEQLWEYINSWPWHSPYTEEYYDEINDLSYRSGKEILGAFFGNYSKPKSLIDVGCGCGFFVKPIIHECDCYGVDLDAPANMQQIKNYMQFDLEKKEQIPIDRKFDLVVSVEVGEHLNPESADNYIKNLCRLGDTVLFSAAFLGQGGNGHINEQPQTYWRDKFYANGFCPHRIDIRKFIWDNKKVAHWYKSGLVVYQNADQGGDYLLDVVHPDAYNSNKTWYENRQH